jgi:hypothetical protein
MADQENGRQPSHGPTRSEASTRQANDPSRPSPYSSENKMKKSDPFGSAAVHRRKHSNNVEGAADNRRFAIVPTQVDTHGPVPGTADEAGHRVAHGAEVISSPLPSPSPGRGGPLSLAAVNAQLAASGSALVAPQDTTNQLSLYDISSAIPSSPCSPSFSSSSHSPTTPKNPHPPSSARSEKSRTARSSAGHSRSSSRDIGIVGTVTRRELPRDPPTPQDTPPDFQPPLFQTPSSRPSSPGPSTTVDTTPSLESGPSAQTSSSAAVHAAMSASVEPIHSVSTAMNGYAALAQPHSTHSLTAAEPRQQIVSTPDQGQVPPAAAAPSASTAPSAYLYYQPGVHSKAGPLPPPPRAMFDIDFNAPPPPRPPRLRSPSPLTSQKSPRAATPTSVTVTLASKASVASIHQIQFSATTPTSTESSSDVSEYTPEWVYFFFLVHKQFSRSSLPVTDRKLSRQALIRQSQSSILGKAHSHHRLFLSPQPRGNILSLTNRSSLFRKYRLKTNCQVFQRTSWTHHRLSQQSPPITSSVRAQLIAQS